MNIIEAIHDKEYFKPFFEDLGTWSAWIAYLKALFALPMTGGERRIFKKCAGGRPVPRKASQVSYVLSGRRSGKSKISSLLAVSLATSRDWTKILSPGEQGHVFLIANDREQAKILKRYVSAILDGAPNLKQLKKKDLAWEIELSNGITIAVRTKNFRTLRGYTVIAAIFEELCFWRSEESASPDYEILAAVKPSMLTVKDPLLIGISSTYAKRGLGYDQYKKYYGKSGGSLIWKSTTMEMNPTADSKTIEEDIKRDPAKFKSEYLSEFRGDIESYLGIDDLDRITDHGIEFRPYDSKFHYSAFCDMSGGKVESAALGISHVEKGKAILDVLLERKAPHSPEEVVEEFSDALKGYRLSSVESDKYAGMWVKDSYEKHNIEVRYSEMPKNEIYAAFIPVAMNGQAVLLDSQRLRLQFSNLERRTRPGGKDTIDHPAGAKDDLCNAAAGALLMSAYEDQDDKTWVFDETQGLHVVGEDEQEEKEEAPTVYYKGIRDSSRRNDPLRPVDLEILDALKGHTDDED